MLQKLILTVGQRLNERNVMSTALCSSGYSIDYATRLSKILARKMKMPVYIGCSMSFAGIVPEEELEGLTRIVHEIMAVFDSQPQGQD